MSRRPAAEPSSSATQAGHERRLESFEPPGWWVASCSCGWEGKATPRKASAASAWGLHAAAARRREDPGECVPPILPRLPKGLR